MKEISSYLKESLRGICASEDIHTLISFESFKKKKKEKTVVNSH